MEDKNIEYDTEKHTAVLIKEFEEFISRKLSVNSVYVYVSVIKSYLSEGNKIDSIENYHKFLYVHTRKNRSTYYYDAILKFIKWINIPKQTKREILTIVKDFGKKDFNIKKKTLFLSTKERWKIISTIKTYKHQLIAWIQNESGVRAGDVLRLKRGSINYIVHKNKVIMQIYFIQKGDKGRKINIFNKQLISQLKEFIRTNFLDREYYFLERKFSHHDADIRTIMKRNYDMYYEDLKKACIKLGHEPKEFTSHDIRRNWAFNVWDNVLDRKDIVALQKAMGHSDINTTILYLRNSGLDNQDVFEKVSEVNDKL